MTAEADIPSEAARHQCFSLVNMLPQNPKDHHVLCEGVEETKRDLERLAKL